METKINTKLTENAQYFLERAEPKLKPEQINVKMYGGWFDDLAFPIVHIKSKITWAERARKFGLEAHSPGTAPLCQFALDENGKPKRSIQGHFIPSESRIAAVVCAYGEMRLSRDITLEPYRKAPIAQALDRAGADLREMVEQGEYEIV